MTDGILDHCHCCTAQRVAPRFSVVVAERQQIVHVEVRLTDKGERRREAEREGERAERRRERDRKKEGRRENRGREREAQRKKKRETKLWQVADAVIHPRTRA